MSDQDNQFCFVPEEKPAVNSDSRNGERFPFFLKVVCLCVLCLGAGVWFFSKQFSRNLSSRRTIQSIPTPSHSTQEIINLEPFFVPLKSEKGTQLTKMEVNLQVDHSRVLDEIQGSINKIKDHLVFILSNQDVSIFSDLESRQLLEKEIANQLNLFLVAGKIENVQLKETFLN